MMIETIIEVCKENPYRDPKTGRFTFAPGNRNKKVSDSDIDVILEVTPNRTRWTFENLGYNCYRFVHKCLAKSIIENMKEEG